jgi:cytochrome P450
VRPLERSGAVSGPLLTLPQVAFTRSGPDARRQRRLMTLGLSASKIASYHPLIAASTRPFMRALLAARSPVDRVAAVRQYAGGLNLRVVYGLEVEGPEDPCLMKVERATELLANEIAGPGLWAVDVFPIRRWGRGKGRTRADEA